MIGKLVAFMMVLAVGFGQTCSKQDKVLIQQRTLPGARQAERLAYYTDVIASFGFSWDVASDSVWSSMSTSDFGEYRGILFADAIDNDFGQYYLGLAASTKDVWSPVVDGNVLIIGSDEAHHYEFGGNSLIYNGLKFVLNNSCNHTGMYMSLSYYYYPQYFGENGGLPTTVAALSYFGTFMVDHHNIGNTECQDASHIVATHAALAGMTDADLSNWQCSVHELFLQYPSNFIPLAIGQSVEGYATGYDGTIRYLDGTSGIPYILAKGDGLVGNALLPSYCHAMDESVECMNSPCDCSEVSNCQVCNQGSGCSQCESGYWMIDNGHKCVNCQEYIEGCQFCQNENGCGQCKSGWTRIFDYNCGYYSCTPDVNPTSSPSDIEPSVKPSIAPSSPTHVPSMSPTQGCGVACDASRGCSKVYNIECDIWYCDCACKEKISVSYLNIENNYNNYEIEAYLGDYYFTGYNDISPYYPIYKHSESDAYFSLFSFYGWTYVYFNVIEASWFFYGSSNNGYVNDNWEITNSDSNPFDGNIHTSEWIIRGYPSVNMAAVFDDCSNEGINFNFEY